MTKLLAALTTKPPPIHLQIHKGDFFFLNPSPASSPLSVKEDTALHEDPHLPACFLGYFYAEN